MTLRASTAALTLALIAMDAAACTVLLGVTDIPAGPDAGPDAGHDVGPPDAPSGDHAAAICTTLFVSPSGHDEDDGCTPETALRTLKAAVSAVENAGTPGYVIQACAGIYDETSLVMNLAGALLGGFDCKTWKRTATYGYPTFDGQNETVVENGSPSSNDFATLDVRAQTGDAGAPLLVDGLTLNGADDLGDSVGVLLESNTDAEILNCRILGGDAAGTSGTTYAVSVTDGATPRIGNNQISAGAALGASGRSIGIFVRSTAPRITANAISASNTASAGGVFGILVTSASPIELTVASGAPISSNVISAGAGNPSVGIQLSGPITADITGNMVAPGQVVPGPDGGAFGIPLSGMYASGTGPLHILGNRFYGGGNQTPGDYPIRAIDLVNVPDAVVADNMLYGGYHDPGGSDETDPSAVELDDCKAPVVVDNTIFSGFGGKASANGVLVTGTTTGAVVRNNVFAGNGSGDTGLLLTTCAGVAALEHNLFVGFGKGTVADQHGCGDAGVSVSSDVTGIAALLPPGTALDGNLIMVSQCSAGDVDAGNCVVNPACPPGMVGSSAPCLSTVFPATWPPHNGYVLWQNADWTLDPGLSCRILRGGIDESDAGFPITTDYNGTPRSATPTLGAVEEADAACE